MRTMVRLLNLMRHRSRTPWHIAVMLCVANTSTHRALSPAGDELIILLIIKSIINILLSVSPNVLLFYAINHVNVVRSTPLDDACRRYECDFAFCCSSGIDESAVYCRLNASRERFTLSCSDPMERRSQHLPPNLSLLSPPRSYLCQLRALANSPQYSFM